MTHLQPTNTYSVEIDKLTNSIELKRGCLWAFAHTEQSFKRKIVKLPPGNWKIIAQWPGCSEDDAAMIVERAIGWDVEPPYKGDMIYKDYAKEKHWFYTALESLRSLLIANNLDPEKHYIILKKEQ